MQRGRFWHSGMNLQPPAAQWAHRGGQIDSPMGERPRTPHPDPASQQVRHLLEARRARTHFFGSHLLADPAWDILLLAYLGLLEREPLLVSAVCRAGVVPATTTLRWVKVLVEQDGLLVCRNGPLDGSGARLELTTAGKKAMESYLASIGSSKPL